MRDVIQCLVDDLRKTPVDSKVYNVLDFMAEEKLKALENGREEPLRHERSSLMANVVDKNSRATLTPARWLPANTLEHFLESRMVSLTQRLRAADLNQRPVIKTDNDRGGAGKQRTYWLDVEPLPEEDSESSKAERILAVRYQRSSTGEVTPSWLMRWIFSNGELKNRSHRGFWLLGLIVLTLTLLALWLAAGLFGLAVTSTTLTLGQLITVAILAAGTWTVWSQLCKPWIELVDHRVVKAPLALLNWKEQSAEIEMHRDNERNQWTRFVRFTADCPICSGRVELMTGKPEHRLPLVGRCIESPHAHVFSFDRTLLDGGYIGPLRTAT